jgi:hypothetical protein
MLDQDLSGDAWKAGIGVEDTQVCRLAADGFLWRRIAGFRTSLGRCHLGLFRFVADTPRQRKACAISIDQSLDGEAFHPRSLRL